MAMVPAGQVFLAGRAGQVSLVDQVFLAGPVVPGLSSPVDRVFRMAGVTAALVLAPAFPTI